MPRKTAHEPAQAAPATPDRLCLHFQPQADATLTACNKVRTGRTTTADPYDATCPDCRRAVLALMVAEDVKRRAPRVHLRDASRPTVATALCGDGPGQPLAEPDAFRTATCPKCLADALGLEREQRKADCQHLAEGVQAQADRRAAVEELLAGAEARLAQVEEQREAVYLRAANLSETLAAEQATSCHLRRRVMFLATASIRQGLSRSKNDAGWRALREATMAGVPIASDAAAREALWRAAAEEDRDAVELAIAQAASGHTQALALVAADEERLARATAAELAQVEKEFASSVEFFRRQHALAGMAEVSKEKTRAGVAS